MLRVSLRLRKGDEVKYLSHRDLIRAFELALRRAGIDVSYSSGFNPRPRMSFGSAIGVGVTSDDERIVLRLASAQEPSEVKRRLNSQLPTGLEVLEAEVVPDSVKSPLSALNASQFRVTLACGEGSDSGSVRAAVETLLGSDEVRVIRTREGKTKETDVRPHVLEASVVEEGEGSTAVDVSLRRSDAGGAGPRDFVQALRKSAPNVGIRKMHRLRQFHASDRLAGASDTRQPKRKEVIENGERDCS